MSASTQKAAANQMQRSPSTRASQTATHPVWFMVLLGTLFGALLLSILMEWIGMAFFWSGEGLQHSQSMIDTELNYLNSDFREGLFGVSPVLAIVDWVETGYYYVFEFTGIENGLAWLGDWLGITDYLLAITTVTQLFLIRLGILVFSLPVYLLMGIVGLTSGLTMRDIRRWSAGREFGRVYHQAKAIAPKALVGAWFLYLSVPVAVHPNAIILPSAMLFGINVTVVAAAYKKYL